MTALTATASPEVKKTILQSLGMSNVNTIQVSPERTNIKYSVTSTLAKDPDSQFHWLFRDIQEHRKQTPKLIIFCQTHRQCRELHAAFEDNLGEDLIFHIAMYHSCTEEQRKEKVMEDFTKAGSFIRVLIATVAFGMGVHVEELYNVLHYGPARDVDDYFQETGRIGRDGKQSYATLLKFPGCFAACKVHERMKDYMETTQCRRQLLLNHYEVSVPSQVIQHLCCDNCSDKCDCSSDSCNADVTKGWLAKHLMRPSASTETPQHFHPQMRTVTDSQRVELQQKVEAYRDSLLQGQEDAMYSGIDMTSGISVSLISTIVQNCHLICSYEDLLKYPFFNDTDAKEIWNVITETLGTEFSSDIVCDTDSDSESDDSVEDEQSQHSSEDIVSRPVLSSNSSSSSD